MPIPIDPVCGQRVDLAAAWNRGSVAQHHGHTWYFCSTACRREFEWNRHAYVMATDVVCGCEVDPEPPETQRWYRDFEATRYYFCSQECQAKFVLAPGFYRSMQQRVEGDSRCREEGQPFS